MEDQRNMPPGAVRAERFQCGDPVHYWPPSVDRILLGHVEVIMIDPTDPTRVQYGLQLLDLNWGYDVACGCRLRRAS